MTGRPTSPLVVNVSAGSRPAHKTNLKWVQLLQLLEIVNCHLVGKQSYLEILGVPGECFQLHNDVVPGYQISSLLLNWLASLPFLTRCAVEVYRFPMIIYPLAQFGWIHADYSRQKYKELFKGGNETFSLLPPNVVFYVLLYNAKRYPLLGLSRVHSVNFILWGEVNCDSGDCLESPRYQICGEKSLERISHHNERRPRGEELLAVSSQ